MTEINKKLDLAMVPPTNNDGDPYILPLDIYKEGYQAYNISNWFKGRVGDNGTPFAIRWYSHGRLLNIQGMRPFIEGQVGDYTIDDSDPDNIRIDMAEDASNIHIVGDVDDTQAGGVAIYRLINQAFPKSGIFYGKIGFMGTQDDGALVNTGVDIVFKILAGHMNMLGARKFYVSELEKAWLDLQEKIRQYDQQYKDQTQQQADQFKADTEKALADLNTKIANEIKRAEDTLGDTQASIDSNIASLKRIAATCASIQAEIDANDIVKLNDFNDQTAALAGGQKKLDSAITAKLANLSAQPELLSNADAIKSKYPNGTTGIKIAIDNWHGYGYINDNWQDLGDYKPTAVSPVNLSPVSTAYLDGGNQVTYRKLNDKDGNTAFSVPQNINIIGNKSGITLDDLKAAAENSSNVKYVNNEFVGNTFLCLYHMSTKTITFESSYTETKPDELILFGVMWNSWVGGILVQNAYNDVLINSARPWKGYLYGRNPLLSYTENMYDTAKKITLALDFNITIYGGEKYLDLTKDKIISDVKNQLKSSPISGITFDESTNELSGDQFALIYDFGDSTVKVIHNSLTTLNVNQVDLFSDYLGNGSIKGIAYEDWIFRSLPAKFKEVKDQIISDIPSNTTDIPKYWLNELQQKIPEIQNNIAKTGNGLEFLWITDNHWESNDKLSPVLMRYVLSHTNIAYMIDGGDHFNSGSTIEDAIDKLSEGYSSLTIPGIDHVSVVGNHDDNKMLSPRDPSKVLSNQQIFKAMFPRTLKSVDLKMTNYPNDLSWQLKFNQDLELTDQKYQYAAFGFDGRLDASKDQIMKFVEFCKNPFKILVFTHGVLDSGVWQTWGTDLGKIIDAINNQDAQVSTESYGVINLVGVQAKVIALISGHEHQDNVKYTDGGTPLIVTDCDCGAETYNNTKYPYVKGTITEQCFSVFTVDLANSKIYEVRVGRGEDREFNISQSCKDAPQPTTPQAQPTEQNKDSDKQ